MHSRPLPWLFSCHVGPRPPGSTHTAIQWRVLGSLKWHSTSAACWTLPVAICQTMLGRSASFRCCSRYAARWCDMGCWSWDWCLPSAAQPRHLDSRRCCWTASDQRGQSRTAAGPPSTAMLLRSSVGHWGGQHARISWVGPHSWSDFWSPQCRWWATPEELELHPYPHNGSTFTPTPG